MGDMTNPYSAPQADEDPSPQDAFYADGLMNATQGVRFANLLLDYVFSFVTCFVLAFVAALVGQPDMAGLVTWPGMIGYYVFFEYVFNATPGKMITRTRVVRLDGGKPSIGQVFGRTFARFVPFEAFSFLGRGASGWHDRWSKTRVVRVT
jgi:uncharacterized RDD family membrane protein YckC